MKGIWQKFPHPKGMLGKLHTEETKQKMSQSRKGIFKGRKLTEEWKNKISETRKRLYKEGKLIGPNKGKPMKDKTKQKLSDSRKTRVDYYKEINSGEKNPQWKNFISKEELCDLYMNKKFGIDRIAKIKKVSWGTIARRMRMWGINQRDYKTQLNLGIQQSIEKYRESSKGSRNPMFGRISYPKLRFVPELGHGVRSKWEERVGLFLKKNNILYRYEGFTFKINNNEETYTPDFPIDNSNIIVEVKGYLAKKSKEKLEKFKKEYTGFIVVAVTSEKAIQRQDFGWADKTFFIDNLDKMESWLNENR